VKRREWCVAAALVSALALLVAPGAATATPVQRLVHEYAPILFLRTQTENPPCDTSEEQFEPTRVSTFLGNPNVTLDHYGPKGRQTVGTAPTAGDIARLGKNYYLNIPGTPLDAGCTYAKDFQKLKKEGRAPAVTYAHVVRKAHAVVVEYWFFWYFNQFNDLHEGDWEGMQIAFDADTPAKALKTGPYEIALYQHAGGEKASWTDEKVQRRRTHPIVYPAAGSHATFFGSAVYLGNGQHGSGVGCDNTSEPVRRLTPTPILMTSRPAPGSRFQWLTYRGHWGQKEVGFSNNGPTGPYEKPQWRHPINWMEGIRSTSPQLPGGNVIGPAASGVFCGAVSEVSKFINLQAQSSTGALVLAVIIAAIVLAPIVLTRWRPADLSRLRQPRAFGQLLRVSRQLYGRYWRVFVPIAATTVALVLAIAGVQWVYHQITGVSDIHPVISIGGFTLDLDISFAGAIRTFGYALITGAIVAAVYLIERDGRATFAGSYRLTFSRIWRLVAAEVLANLILLGLVITLIGAPIAAWKFVDWQFIQQEILFEDRSIREAFRGSTRVVRDHWWRTLAIAGFLSLLIVVPGPVLGFFLIFANFSLSWVNVASSVVYALLIPFVTIGRTLLYLDLRARDEIVGAKAPRWRRLLARFRRWRAGRRVAPQPGEAAGQSSAWAPARRSAGT
jgi:hypothetical protein